MVHSLMSLKFWSVSSTYVVTAEWRASLSPPPRHQGSGTETGPRCSSPGGGEAGSDEEDVAASAVTMGVNKEDWCTKSEATTPELTMVISVLPSSAERMKQEILIITDNTNISFTIQHSVNHSKHF